VEIAISGFLSCRRPDPPPSWLVQLNATLSMRHSQPHRSQPPGMTKTQQFGHPRHRRPTHKQREPFPNPSSIAGSHRPVVPLCIVPVGRHVRKKQASDGPVSSRPHEDTSCAKDRRDDVVDYVVLPSLSRAAAELRHSWQPDAATLDARSGYCGHTGGAVLLEPRSSWVTGCWGAGASATR